MYMHTYVHVYIYICIEVHIYMHVYVYTRTTAGLYVSGRVSATWDGEPSCPSSIKPPACSLVQKRYLDPTSKQQSCLLGCFQTFLAIVVAYFWAQVT